MVEVPAEAAGKTLHLIVEVTDEGAEPSRRIPALTRYRRAVLDVE